MKIFSFVLFAVLFISCKFNFSTSDERATDNKTTVESKDSPVKIKIEDKGNESAGKNPQLDWEFVSKGNAEFDTPVTEVYLLIDKKKEMIMEEKLGFNKLDKEAFETYKIPKDALTAAYGWWAGWGMILYVVRNGDNFDVYKIHLEEGYMDDKGEQVTPEFEPEKIKSVKVG